MQNSVLEANVSSVSRNDVLKAHTIVVLQQLGWNRVHAARALGISLSTIHRNLRAWGIAHIWDTDEFNHLVQSEV
jgi:transcriptional regulator of acetoin/glycerol metabolism